MRPSACARLALGVLLLTAPTFSDGDHGQPALEDAQVVGLDTTFSDFFGISVSLSGDRALVGAHLQGGSGAIEHGAGAAYVFERQADGSWLQVAKLTASDGALDDHFGLSASLSGDRALVGAPDQGPSSLPPFTDGPGAAYMFERQASGSWLEVAKLTASDGGENDRFGDSVSLLGDRALIAAPRDGSGSAYVGSAYVFERQAGGAWSEVAKFTASDPVNYADNRFEVSLGVDRALVGVPGDFEHALGSGAAYVFERQVDGSWPQVAKLKASDPEVFAVFGMDVSLSGDVALIGAPGLNDETGEGIVAAYVFERQVDGSWAEVAKLKAEEADVDATCAAVSVFGNRALIGAHKDNWFKGSAYLFEREADGSWTEIVKFSGTEATEYGDLGQSVALSDDHALAGAPMYGGASPAFVFDLGVLYHGEPFVSVTSGGTHDLLLRAGSEHAGETYVLLGSLSGTSPGLTDPLSGLVLPLNPDAYFFWLLKHGGGGLVSPFVGALDAEGAAGAWFALPPGAPPSLVGLTLHHAYVALDFPGTGAATLASNAVRVEIVP